MRTPIKAREDRARATAAPKDATRSLPVPPSVSGEISRRFPGSLFDRSAPTRLVLMTLLLLALAFFWTSPSMTQEEARLYSRIRAAENALWSEMERRGEADPESDPDRTGFVGLEWSTITTTLGSLESKQSACDPIWGAQCLRWFDSLNLKAEDRIVVLSSSSFPGMLYAVLAAAESRGIRVDLAVSLGSSTWGANRPEAPWPVLEGILRSGGFLQTKPHFYTLGGGGENGGEMWEEGVDALVRASRAEGVELFRSSSLSEIIERKLSLIDIPGLPRAALVVSVGGSLANLGRDEIAAISLRNGLLFPSDAPLAGNGAIAGALKRGVPVLHLLNLRSLAERSGIDFERRRPYFAGRSVFVSLAGIALFIFFMATHRRWTWEN